MPRTWLHARGPPSSQGCDPYSHRTRGRERIELSDNDHVHRAAARWRHLSTDLVETFAQAQGEVQISVVLRVSGEVCPTGYCRSADQDLSGFVGATSKVHPRPAVQRSGPH